MAETRHFYENMYALQQLAKSSTGDPASEAHRLLEKAKKVSMRPTYAGEVAYESVKALSTRNFIAFFLLRTPAQSCSVYIVPTPEQVTLYISKSSLDAKDKALSTELQQYVESGAASLNQETDEASFSKFEVGFLNIIVKHCSSKILELCKKVTLSGVGDVLRKASSPNAFTDEDIKDAILEEEKLGEQRIGDKMLLEFSEMLAKKGGVGEGIRMSLQVITEFIDRATDDGQALCTLSTFCHCLGTSFIARRILRKIINDGPRAEEFFYNLIQLGRYARGAERLQQKLLEADFSGLPKVRLVYTPSRAKKISWDTSSTEILSDIYKNHGSQIRINDPGTEELVVNGIKWVQSMKVKMHVEVALILYLREQGLKGGDIGVSQPCCGICWNTVEKLNDLYDEHWNLSGNHGGKVTITLATGIDQVDKDVALKVRNALALLVDAHIASAVAKGISSAESTPSLSLAKLDALLSNFKVGFEQSTRKHPTPSSNGSGNTPNSQPASYARAVGPADPTPNPRAPSTDSDSTTNGRQSRLKVKPEQRVHERVEVKDGLENESEEGWIKVTYRQKSSSPLRNRNSSRRRAGRNRPNPNLPNGKVGKNGPIKKPTEIKT